jgi:hypothetical protein
MMDKLRETEISPKTGVVTAVIFLIIVVGAAMLFVNKQSGTQTTATQASVSIAVPKPRIKVKVKERAQPEQKTADKQTAKSDEPVDMPQTIADRNVFKPLRGGNGQAPSVPPMSIGALPGLPDGARFGRFMRGGDSGSSSSLAFTGIVQTPEGTMALIENTATQETKFLRPGESAFGMRLVMANASGATLDAGGQSVYLAIGENKGTVSTSQPQSTTSASASSGQPASVPTPGITLPPGMDPSMLAAAMRRMGRRNRSSTGAGQ